MVILYIYQEWTKTAEILFETVQIIEIQQDQSQLYDMREEHNCLFEKVPFEIYVCKKKETIIKLLCYRKERNFMLYSTTEE